MFRGFDVNIFNEHFIKDIERLDDKFVIKTDELEFKEYDKVLISNGLGAAPQLNANESGLDFASKFGHSYNPTYPSLVGLQTDAIYNSKLQGVKRV